MLCGNEMQISTRNQLENMESFAGAFQFSPRVEALHSAGHRSKPRFESGGLCVISGDSTTDLLAFHCPTIRAEAPEYEGAAEGFWGHN